MSTPSGGAAESTQIDEAAVPVVPEFLDEIEELMLRGQTRTHIAAWCREHHNMEIKQVELLVDLIRGVWAAERDPGRLATRRDQLRMQYNYVFAKAIQSDRLDTAIKALDSLAKIDGAIQPDLNINVSGATITSRTRERIQELLGKVQSLGNKPLPMIDVRSVGGVEEQMLGQVVKNGNGVEKQRNGRLAPHPLNPPEDE